MHCCHQDESAPHMGGGGYLKAANSSQCQSHINLENSQGTVSPADLSFSHIHTLSSCYCTCMKPDLLSMHIHSCLILFQCLVSTISGIKSVHHWLLQHQRMSTEVIFNPSGFGSSRPIMTLILCKQMSVQIWQFNYRKTAKSTLAWVNILILTSKSQILSFSSYSSKNAIYLLAIVILAWFFFLIICIRSIVRPRFNCSLITKYYKHISGPLFTQYQTLTDNVWAANTEETNTKQDKEKKSSCFYSLLVCFHDNSQPSQSREGVKNEVNTIRQHLWTAFKLE